jgi:hypothetical protein
VFRSSIKVRRVMQAYLKWMPMTPYKPEMVQVCRRRHQRSKWHKAQINRNIKIIIGIIGMDTKLRLIEI